MKLSPLSPLAFIITLLMLVLSATAVQAAGARSPEALAMTFVQAFRSADIHTVETLHAKSVALDTRQTEAWRTLMRNYRLSGYRVINLSPADRTKLAENQSNPTPLPIKKFVAQLVAVRSGEQLVLERYIGVENGRFYFVTPDVR